MANSYEQISKQNANSNGKTDANIANDALHLGGIDAENFATKKYVEQYHTFKEDALKQYIDLQDTLKLNQAKEYANSLVRNQDFTSFAKNTDIQALDRKLSEELEAGLQNQKNYTDTQIATVVEDVNDNFSDVNTAITNLNNSQRELFQSVSSGKAKVAGAITDKGISTSADATFEQMANNIRNINGGGDVDPMIVIPDGYVDTSDANASSNQILQGYTAYANGEKIYGTYVGEGSPGGGVILGENEVVATKIYGEAGVLAGGKLETATDITISSTTLSSKVALVCTKLYGDFAIAYRKLTESVDEEIIIYNISSSRTLYHKSANSKFSYTLSELGISGEIKCIVASPLEYWTGIVQISIGTSVGIYTYLFDATGNNENGEIGGSFSSKTKVVISNLCSDYNAIAYSNTDKNTFAYYDGSNVHIVKISWTSDTNFIEYTSVRAEVYGDNVMAQFRFSPSDRFLTFASWGRLRQKEVYIILLDDFRYVVHQKIAESTSSTSWTHGQILINNSDNFMILFGKPYSLEWDIKNKTITYLKKSDVQIIPYNEDYNESLYATFSKDDKYVYATSFESVPDKMYSLRCYKVNFLDLSNIWKAVSSLLKVPANGNIPTIDIVNKKILGFLPADSNAQGFYYYQSDSNIKEVIGLSYDANYYVRT